ncbi:MFS transporter [Halobacillus sp. Cin3]|uniref:MFS transporter n=1 Tax=Halobacillus sp. Cin3 TaxID=2928441 RepID=UPI00248EA899|nr:MFS transporter [Halobacillus sp. Cin3]
MKPLSKAGVFALMLAASLTVMVGSAITPALLDISQHYNMEDSAAWLTTLPSLGVVLFAPLAGKFIDKSGPYRALCTGLILYGGLGITAIWLDGTVLVLADRILLGGATAVVMSSATGLLAEFFEGEKRLKMMALQGMSIEAGGIIFLSIGGILGSFGWQFPFLLYLLGWIALVFLLSFVPFTKKETAEEAEADEGSSSEKIWPVLLSAMLAMTIFFVTMVSVPFYLAEHFHMTSTGTGYFMAMISLVAVISASQMPKVVNKISDYSTLMTGFFLFGGGYLLLGLNQTSLLLAVGAGILIGFGFGFTIPLANHMTVEKSSTANRGKNLAYFSSAVFLGQFLSSFVDSISDNLSIVYLLTASAGLLISAIYFITLKNVRTGVQKMKSPSEG